MLKLITLVGASLVLSSFHESPPSSVLAGAFLELTPDDPPAPPHCSAEKGQSYEEPVVFESPNGPCGNDPQLTAIWDMSSGSCWSTPCGMIIQIDLISPCPAGWVDMPGFNWHAEEWCPTWPVCLMAEMMK